VGGGWIVKLPSNVYSGVPENEFVMMELARHIGIDVPETALISIDDIHGLPQGIRSISNHAFIIKRFDRTTEGQAVHIEDFAQVFGVFPEKKYQAASYRNIVEVIHAEQGEEGIIEFIRRFVFNALIGNGDMHLKKWSLIYHDKKNASLAPAYDFVSTIPYIPNEGLALSFVDSKSFSSLSYDQFKRFAQKSRLPESIVLDTARETVQSFKTLWQSIDHFPLDKNIIEVIDNHLKTIPLWMSNL
jgi:serine/threonine-protein kinase HipA